MLKKFRIDFFLKQKHKCLAEDKAQDPSGPVGNRERKTLFSICEKCVRIIANVNSRK